MLHNEGVPRRLTLVYDISDSPKFLGKQRPAWRVRARRWVRRVWERRSEYALLWLTCFAYFGAVLIGLGCVVWGFR